MADEKDNNQRTRIPYEPPRLFDLGVGVAHAAKPCRPGGSPTGDCSAGTNPLVPATCKSGGIAAQGDCKDGGIPQVSCKVGSTK